MKKTKCTGYRKLRAMSSILAALILTGCLKTPDTEFITNKEGQSTLIADHTAIDEGILIREQVQASDTITESIDVNNENVTLEIDAKVSIPEVTALPVYRFAPIEFTPEYIEAFVMGFYDDGKVFNGYPYYTERSKEDVYEEIEECNAQLNHEIVDSLDGVPEDRKSNGCEFDEEGNIVRITPEYVEQTKREIARLQEELKTLPDHSPDYGDPVSYEMRELTEDLYYFDASINESKGAPYHRKIAYFTGLRNGQEYYLLFEEDAWNRRIYISRPPGTATGEKGITYSMIYINYLHRGEVKQNECRYSVEEAEEMGREILKLTGMEDMDPGCILESELLHSGQSIGEAYSFCFLPSVNGVTDVYLSELERSMAMRDPAWIAANELKNRASSRMDEFMEDKAEEEEFMVPEQQTNASFLITDEGLLVGEIYNPKIRGELLAENVELLDFDQVVKQGINQIKNLYADKGSSIEKFEVRVKTIELSYAYMQSPENPDEYIMIPVWDFKSGDNGTIYVTINAIDGSVVERNED